MPEIQMPPHPIVEVAAERDKLRELLRLYAKNNDCPVCHASPKLIDQKVEVLSPGRVVAYSGGRWHVDHGLSCDVGLALAGPSESADE
jgi:hypothetical protein